MTDATWSCTNAFADRVYSKYVCQYNTAACGTTQSFVLANTNSTASINVAALALGQTCFYKVQAMCGGPAFKPNVTDGVTTLNKFEIEFVTYRDGETNATGTDAIRTYTLTSNDTVKRASAPATQMPRRDHYFASAAGGNQVVNQNYTSYNASTNGTVYGISGRYDRSNSLKKLYGNPTQSDSAMSNLTNPSNADCANRTLLLAVTAITDASSIRIYLSSVAFYRAPTVDASSGASFLSMTIAAVLGLISLAFF